MVKWIIKMCIAHWRSEWIREWINELISEWKKDSKSDFLRLTATLLDTTFLIVLVATDKQQERKIRITLKQNRLDILEHKVVMLMLA